MEIAACCDVGKVRRVNEDGCYISAFADDCGFLIVADGMGGHRGGSTASQMAVEEIRRSLAGQTFLKKSAEQIEGWMKRAVEQANQAVYERALSEDSLSGMGTTVVLSIVVKQTLYTLNVGDSRLYYIRSGNIIQVTKDHSVVQELIDLGEITPEEATVHPSKNIITRAVGTDCNVEYDFYVQNMQPNDVALLCTDGLSNMLSDAEILALNKDGISMEAYVKSLVHEANARGGYDNITALAVRF